MTQPQPPARGIKLVSQVMVSAHFFVRARLAYALTRRRAHMMVNPGHWHRTLLIVSLVLALTLSIGYVIWGWLKPAGTISDNTKIVADRTTATIYVVLAGRLYPATNLTSARLITSTHDNPTYVSSAEIAKHPKGPQVGIIGASPEVNSVVTPQVSQFHICDSIERPGAQPTVTVIGGQISADIRPEPFDGVLQVTNSGRNYLVGSDYRAAVDSPFKDAIPVSRALLNAIPARTTLPTKPKQVAPAAVLCVSWRFDTGETQPTTTVHLYRGLPLTTGQRNQIIRTVGKDRDGLRADQMVLNPHTPTYITATNTPGGVKQRASVWLLAANGTRFGVPPDRESIKALGVDKATPSPAPWAMIAPWPPGPELSRRMALVQHSPGDAEVLIDKPTGEQ